MASKTTTITGGPGTGTESDPFILKQGRTFGLVVTVKDAGAAVDLLTPPRTGRSELRNTAENVGPPLATFVVTIRSPQTGADKGKADVSLGATVSESGANPAVPPGLYVSDVEFVNTGDDDDVLSSDVFFVRVVAEVTKS